ncbi:MAG TPA: FHA domain-containing protein [Pyrinomonadaceae bacterium]
MKNQYLIIRDDLLTDPVTVISAGLLIGRLMECEVLLNYPTVSRAQAGIKQIDDHYYLFPLRPSNPVTLNGNPVEDNEALASGDVIGVGPFRLDIENTEPALVIRVSVQIGMETVDTDVSSPSLATGRLLDPQGKQPRAAPIPGTKTLDIFWDKRIREAGKLARRSPLSPREGRRSGKAQFLWKTTSDLKDRWRGSLFLWAMIVVGVISVAAVYVYANAFAPGPLSKSHSETALTMLPPIASKANSGACTSCHAWKGKMEDRCAECHHTDAFVASVNGPHAAAGIDCVACHAEHKGENFNARVGAFETCTGCHNDSNKQVYNGKRVSTPHGGTFGYPVVNGVWSLKAVNDEEWDLKKIPIVRLPSDDDSKWKSKQFHALHSERVRVVPGIQGNSLGQMSCSSCHRSFDPIDREGPRTTCGVCHNGLTEGGTVLIASDKPNCTSCHVQHVQDKRQWSNGMLSIGPATQ